MTKTRTVNQRIFYGWIIVACTFIFGFINYGIRNSFSVFYAAILNEFNWSRADTAFIFSLNILLYGLTAPVSGILADKFGPRKVIPMGALLLTIGMIGCAVARELWHFYLFFGVICAIGSCVAGFSQYLPLVARWFVRDRSKALGITMAGGCLCLSFSLLAEYIINILGWRNTFIVIGIIPSAVIIPLNLVFIRWPEEMGLSHRGNPRVEASNELEAVGKPITLGRTLKSASFWLIFSTYFLCWGVGLNMFLAHTVTFLRDVGFDPLYSAFIFSSYGIFQAVGNSCGFIVDRFDKTKIFFAGSTSTVLALFLLATVTVSSPWKLYAWLVLFGMGVGIDQLALNGVTVDLFEGKHLGAINGCLILGFGIGGCLGPYIAGYIFDVTKTYTLAFYLAMTAFSVACLLILTISHINKKR